MCKKAFGNCLFLFEYCLDKLTVCVKKPVNSYPLTLQYVPDWFVTPKMLEFFGNNDDLDNLFTWHNKYKQRKAYEKRQIWHPKR